MTHVTNLKDPLIMMHDCCQINTHVTDDLIIALATVTVCTVRCFESREVDLANLTRANLKLIVKH